MSDVSSQTATNHDNQSFLPEVTYVDIFKDGLRACGDGLEQQINGASQLVNRITHTHLPEIDFVATPATPTCESARIAQSIGGALSMVPVMFAMQKGFGKFAPEALARSTVAQGVATGGAFGFVTHHVENGKQEFWTERGKSALVDAITFGGMNGVSKALHMKAMPVNRLESVGYAFASGVGAGAINAEANAVVRQGRHASGAELLYTTREFGVLSAVLAGLHGLPKPEPTVRGPQSPFANNKNLADQLSKTPEEMRAVSEKLRNLGLAEKKIFPGAMEDGSVSAPEAKLLRELGIKPEKVARVETLASPVRVSVASIVPSLKVIETGETHYFGLLNRKKLAKGEKSYGALGGAVEMTEQGAKHLESEHAAKFQEGADARFIVDAKSVDSVFDFFRRRNSSNYEVDATREIQEELGKIELAGQTEPILNKTDLDSIKVKFVETKAQDATRGTSGRDTEIPSRRLFFVHQIEVPQSVMNKLSQSPFIRMLSESEIEQGKTNDGHAIADNIIKSST